MNKQKAKKRLFQDLWTEKYGCVDNGDKVMCTLCMDTITARTYNIERHFSSKHKDVSEMTNEDKSGYIAERVKNFGKQNKVIKNTVTGNNHATSLASFVAALAIATNGKPFTDGDFLKNIFINCSEHLFNDFANKEEIIQRVKEMPLSARTVQRRIEDMARDIDEQVKSDLLSCDVISIAVYESADLNSIGRLAIIIRYAAINSPNVNEEICILASANDTTKGADIFRQVQEFTNLKNGEVLDLKSKLFSVTTYGAASMRGKTVDFIKLMEKELGRSLLLFHWVVHEENLFERQPVQLLKDMMDKIFKIINIIIVRSALMHRRFKAFLDESDSKHGDSFLHCQIQWLSRGRILNRFLEFFDDIKIFLDENGESDPELNDKQWLLRLLFLTDVVNHLNDHFKVLPQGSNHPILVMYEEWKSFNSKLTLLESDIKTKKFQFFPLLRREHERGKIDGSNHNMFENLIFAIKTECESRFKSFKEHGEMFEFIIRPGEVEENVLNLKYFEYLKIDNFHLEMIDFNSSILWTDKFRKLRKDLEITDENHLFAISKCWASLPTKFSSLKKIAFAILSIFGSTYKREQIFSQIKFILSKNRNRLTTENSDACVRLKMTNYKPDLIKLTSKVQHQGSH